MRQVPFSARIVAVLSGAFPYQYLPGVRDGCQDQVTLLDLVHEPVELAGPIDQTALFHVRVLSRQLSQEFASRFQVRDPPLDGKLGKPNRGDAFFLELISMDTAAARSDNPDVSQR